MFVVVMMPNGASALCADTVNQANCSTCIADDGCHFCKKEGSPSYCEDASNAATNGYACANFCYNGSNPCFIATAAYGSPLHADIVELREFRDEVLAQSAFGRVIIDTYYTVSPSIANVVATSVVARSVVRAALFPVVLAVQYPTVVLSVVAALCVVVASRKN
jgi:hypothetical protein